MGLPIDNLEVIDAEIVSVVEETCHGPGEVEEGGRPQIWLFHPTASSTAQNSPRSSQLRGSLFERCLSSV
jgi:hypothetical protein